MTIAEQLRQQGEQHGIQRGCQEGIHLGEAKALKEMARKMMLNGMDQQAIMAVTGLSKDEFAQLSH